MLTPRHTAVVFALLMSGTMAAIVSAVVVVINTGIDAGTPQRWLSSYVIAWPVAFASLFTLKDRVMKLAQKLTSSSDKR